MKTITLNTGIKITQDSNGNIKTLYSPYVNEVYNMTRLRHYVQQIKKLIK